MIHGIVLAAGQGRRIGCPKALLTVDGVPFHRRVLDALMGAGLEVVTVVSAPVDEALPRPGTREERVINPDPDQQGGMFASVRLGAAMAVKLGATGAVLLPVDHPFVSTEDVRSVLEGLNAGGAIVVPKNAGRRGHPIGLSLSVLAEIQSAAPDSTLRDLVHRDPGRVVEVAASVGAILGINTREDLEHALNRSFR